MIITETKLNIQGAPMSPARAKINTAIIMATIANTVDFIRLMS